MKYSLLVVCKLLILSGLTTSAYAHNKVVVIPLGDESKPTPQVVRVSEDAGTVTIPLQRTGGSEGELTVRVRTRNGTAMIGQDYSGISVPLTLTWFDGDTSPRTITLPILADNLHEPDESFSLIISSTNPDWVGPRNEIVIVIEDNPPGKIQFELDTYAVSESASTITLTLQRVGGSAGQISANIQTVDGTATNGIDYTGIPTPLTLTWLDGNTNPRTVTLPIASDSISEGRENFSAQISSADPNWVGLPSTATVTISDFFIVVGSGKVRLSPLEPKVSETDGTVSFTLERVDGSFLSLSVDVSTTDGSAKINSDYGGIGNPLTLTWPNGNTTPKTVTLPIRRDNLLEGNETFRFNVTGARMVGPSSATVTIKDVPPGKIEIGEP